MKNTQRTRRSYAHMARRVMALVNIPLLPVSGRLGREEAIAIALREYNLSRPAWESFKTLEQLELGNALWVIERSYQLRGV